MRIKLVLLLLVSLLFPAISGESTDIVKNGDFSKGQDGWTLVRCKYNEETHTVEFNSDGQQYYMLLQRIATDLPAGTSVSIEADLTVADPGDQLKEKKGNPQVLLYFEDKEGKKVYSQGEAGKAKPITATNGKMETFALSYKIPAGTATIIPAVKTGVPLRITVHAIRVLAEKKKEITDGSFPFMIRGMTADSVANSSFLNHKPAGKYGFLHNDKGDFVFDNGQKVRWFGVNIVASRLFDSKTHEEADRFVQKLAGLGINIARIHHLTPVWQKEIPFYIDRTKSTLEFNDKALEKIDYLLFALKNQGIYVTNEMTDSSLCPAPKELSYPVSSNLTIKIAAMFDPEAQEYMKKWIKAFYCRKNRYTGKRLIDDPQLAMLGIINELSVAYHNGRFAKFIPEELKQPLNEQFQKYLIERNIQAKKFDLQLMETDSVKFWDYLCRKSFKMWKEYLQSLGYKGLVSGSNFGENFFHLAASTEMDFMDSHLYWGHASYMDGVDAKTRYLSDNRWSDLVKPPHNEGSYTKELFARYSMASVPEMPLISSEHRTAISNFNVSRFRAAGLPFFSTINAFQDWDGFYLFASQGNNLDRMEHRLDIRYDTTYLATLPVSALLLRGDAIKPAKESILVELNEKDIYSESRGLSFLNDGLFNLPEQHKVRIQYPWKKADKSAFTKTVTFDSLLKMPQALNTGSVIKSDTGDFYRNWEQGYFVVNTDKVQGVEGFFDKTGSFDFKDYMLNASSSFGVFFVSCGGDKDIKTTKRLLFTAVGECFNSGDIDQPNNGWALPGTPPVMVKPVKGKLVFKDGKYDVWSLGENGERIKKVIENTDSFDFDTGRDKTIWYEFVRL